MQSPVTTAATTKISVETAADAEDERMAVEFEGPPRYGKKVRVWRWKFYQAQPMPSVEAGVRVLIGTTVLVNPASASGSRVKNNTTQHSVSTCTQAEVFLDS